MDELSPQQQPGRPYWLAIAYAFPPISRSGTYRTLGFVRHLDQMGWDAAVVTVEPWADPMDESISDLLPPSASVYRTAWIDLVASLKRIARLGTRRKDRIAAMAASLAPDQDEPGPTGGRRGNGGVRDWVSRLLTTPDSRLGWVIPGYRKAMWAIRRRRPDVIYSTSPYMSAHLIALLVARRTRLPWVADLRDPWHDNPFRDFGHTFIKRWDAFLERMVLDRATRVVCNTPTMADQLCRRVPVVAGKCAVIPNGFDADQMAGVEPIRLMPPEDFQITHCGQFYGPRSPVVWFAALRQAMDRIGESGRSVHFVLIGPNHYEGRSLNDLAASAGIGGHVHVLGRRSRRQAVAHMLGSNALMLAGSSGLGATLQVPAKLFEYLYIQRPILAAVADTNPAVGILQDARADFVKCQPDDTYSLADAIVRLVNGIHAPPADAWARFDQFDRRHRAKELAALFQQLTGQAARTVKRRDGLAQGHPLTPSPAWSMISAVADAEEEQQASRGRTAPTYAET